MSVRNLLLIALPVAALSIGCAKSPLQAEGVVTTTRTTTSTSTTTSVIPDLTGGVIAAAPKGAGIAAATVFSFSLATPPTGGVPPYTESWTFGDGAEGAGTAPSHLFLSSGVFTTVLTTTDSRGITAKTSTPITIGNVTGRWVAFFSDFQPEGLDVIQNQTALTVTINDTTNGLGFAAGTGSLANPRMMSVSATFGGLTPFAVTYIGTLDENLRVWSGVVTGYSGCPCPFTAIR
jgi:PKD domain